MKQADPTDTSRRMADMEKSLAALEKRVALQEKQIADLLTIKDSGPQSDIPTGVELFRFRQEIVRQRAIHAERRARKASR